jgi:hypothetical protein
MAIAYWVEQMASDVDKAIVDRKEELLMETLERFSTNTLLKPQRSEVGNQWFTL